MIVLIIGGGGREHAIGRKLKKDDPGLRLHSAPGNPGLAALGTCHGIDVADVTALVALAQDIAPHLVIVGPEAPLTLGLVDQLRACGIACFGPSAAAAQLEASKAFAKEAMAESGIPTARYELYDTAAQAAAALHTWQAPLVLKADGLAAGKGVIVCETMAQAIEGIGELEPLQQPILIEEFMEGPEISLFAIVRGETVIPLVTAQDHKRVGEGDTGPNTGGMGAYSPGQLPAELSIESLCDLSVGPLARTMSARGTPFDGVLFVGLMLTPSGPKVLEYNVRFGDPECQVLMTRLSSALLPLLDGSSVEAPQWDARPAMTVVLAAGGYPGAYAKGLPLGLPKETSANAHVIHAGTTLVDGQLVSSGGRVLNAVASGATLHAARDAAYALLETIGAEGLFYRKDIGWRALELG